MTNNNNIVEEVQGAEATTEGKVNMMFPTELLKKLEVLFADDKIDFNKILFTVYWINKGKYNSLKKMHENYQEVSSRYGNWISLVGKKGTDFIKKLVDGGIIKKVSGYVTAKHYTRYTLVNPFNYKGGDATGDMWTIYTLYPEDGAFIKKYLSDKHVVRISSTVNNTKNIVKKAEAKQHEVNEVVDIATGEVIDVVEEFKNIKMTLKEVLDNYNELSNKIKALEVENAKLKAELSNKINKKVDITSSLKNEMQQYTFISTIKDVITPAPEVIETPSDYDNTPFFIEDNEDYGFVFPNEQKVEPQVNNSISSATTTVCDYTKYIENKLKSSRVQPIYWDRAIKYITDNDELNAIELGKIISISTGSSQQLINKIKRYSN